MVAKGNKDGHRYSYSGGVKALSKDKWGANKAVERYGALRQPDMRPKDVSGPQRLGDPNNLHGPGYHNDTANDWRRGNGMNPNFDYMTGGGNGRGKYHGKR
jgi:hypothetical protein